MNFTSSSHAIRTIPLNFENILVIVTGISTRQSTRKLKHLIQFLSFLAKCPRTLARKVNAMI